MFAAGWLLGGNVGVGTVAFALLIGPLVHLTLPLFDTRRERRVVTPDEDAEEDDARQGAEKDDPAGQGAVIDRRPDTGRTVAGS